METDAELLARYRQVEAQYDKAKAGMERLKLGSPARTRKAQWAGSLNFTLLDIKSQIEEPRPSNPPSPATPTTELWRRNPRTSRGMKGKVNGLGGESRPSPIGWTTGEAGCKRLAEW